MTKTDLINALAEKQGGTKTQAASTVDSVFEILKETLAKGETVQLLGFGTFSIGERAARTGRNPKTGEAIQIKASKTIKFTAGKALKDAL